MVWKWLWNKIKKKRKPSSLLGFRPEGLLLFPMAQFASGRPKRTAAAQAYAAAQRRDPVPSLSGKPAPRRLFTAKWTPPISGALFFNLQPCASRTPTGHPKPARSRFLRDPSRGSKPSCPIRLHDPLCILLSIPALFSSPNSTV